MKLIKDLIESKTMILVFIFVLAVAYFGAPENTKKASSIRESNTQVNYTK